METEQRQVSTSVPSYHGRNFHCMYTSKVGSSGKNEYFALMFQGTNPNPHLLEGFLQLLSEGRETSGHPPEPKTLYNVNPSKVAIMLGVHTYEEIIGVWTDEEARQIVENLGSLK